MIEVFRGIFFFNLYIDILIFAIALLLMERVRFRFLYLEKVFLFTSSCRFMGQKNMLSFAYWVLRNFLVLPIHCFILHRKLRHKMTISECHY